MLDRLSVYSAWHETTALLFHLPIPEELMEGVDCCAVPMTNRRQGNQLVATAFNIPLKPGGDVEASLASASGLIIKGECFPKASACRHITNSFTQLEYIEFWMRCARTHIKHFFFLLNWWPCICECNTHDNNNNKKQDLCYYESLQLQHSCASQSVPLAGQGCRGLHQHTVCRSREDPPSARQSVTGSMTTPFISMICFQFIPKILKVPWPTLLVFATLYSPLPWTVCACYVHTRGISILWTVFGCCLWSAFHKISCSFIYPS